MALAEGEKLRQSEGASAAFPFSWPTTRFDYPEGMQPRTTSRFGNAHRGQGTRDRHPRVEIDVDERILGITTLRTSPGKCERIASMQAAAAAQACR